MFDGSPAAPKHELTCQHCGRVFLTNQTRQKFCSRRCGGFGALHPQRAATGLWLTLDGELARLWADGKSGIEIAAHFSEHGITRNAVIGRVHRLKLPKRIHPVKAAKVKRAPRPKCFARLPKQDHRNNRFPGSILNDRMNARLRLAPVKPPSQPIPQGTKTLIELGRDECRYPHGQSPDWAFCGLPVAIEGTSWCEEHRQLCFQPLRPSTKRLIWRGR